MSEKQMVEIVKALSFSSKLIIMDEPSSSLTAEEMAELVEIIHHLRETGISIIYISHKLDEIFQFCDIVSVMRDGHVVDTKAVAEFTRNELVSKMVGRTIENEYPARPHSVGEVVMEVRSIRTHKLHDISFKLHKGEILGLVGLVGAGRTEIVRAIYGADKARGPAVQMTPPFARDHVRRGPPGAAAVKSRIGVAAFRTGARLLWLVALAVHLASFTASGLAIGAFLDPKNPLAAASRPLQLVGAAARAHPDGVSWLTYSGMSLVPVVIQWVALLLAVTMVGRGVRAYGRTVPPNADSRGLRWARRLPRFFGVTAVPAYWFGALTWLTITVRCLVPSLERLGCFPCALMPAGVFLIVTGLVQVTLLPGRLVRGLVGRWEQGTPVTGRAARAVRR